MCSGYNPNPDELDFDLYELAGRKARRRKRKKRRQERRARIKRRLKKVGKGVAKVGKIAAKVAGPILTATGIGAPVGAALTAGTAVAAAAKRLKSSKAGQVATTAAKLAGELSAGGAWLEADERKLLRHPQYRRAVLSHIRANAQNGNSAALIALSKLNRRAMAGRAA